MLQQLYNHAFQTDIYDILRNTESIEKIRTVRDENGCRIEYKKSSKEKLSYAYGDYDMMMSDYSSYKFLFDSFYYGINDTDIKWN